MCREITSRLCYGPQRMTFTPTWGRLRLYQKIALCVALTVQSYCCPIRHHCLSFKLKQFLKAGPMGNFLLNPQCQAE